MSGKPIIPIIAGPTASGKTDFSYRLIDSLRQIIRKTTFPIVSADSRQLYKYLDIGTAKPTLNELKDYQHYFINVLELNQTYSSGEFGKEALSIINKELDDDNLPIICGGTGFYIKSLIEGLDTDTRDEKIKSQVSEKLEGVGKDDLFTKLKSIDPESACRFSDKNPVRLIRALEYYYQTGNKFSEIPKKKLSLPFDYLYILPNYIIDDSQRSVLYTRINKRCEFMWQNGLKEELNDGLRLLDINIHELKIENEKIIGLPNSLNTVGYKEAILHLNGMEEDKAIELFQRNTRRYAKRQMTWFRRVYNENQEKTIIVDFADIKSIDQVVNELT